MCDDAAMYQAKKLGEKAGEKSREKLGLNIKPAWKMV
jgi:hypothetical protein